jgi:hypothetical protein
MRTTPIVSAVDGPPTVADKRSQEAPNTDIEVDVDMVKSSINPLSSQSKV